MRTNTCKNRWILTQYPILKKVSVPQQAIAGFEWAPLPKLRDEPASKSTDISLTVVKQRIEYQLTTRFLVYIS